MRRWIWKVKEKRLVSYLLQDNWVEWPGRVGFYIFVCMLHRYTICINCGRVTTNCMLLCMSVFLLFIALAYPFHSACTIYNVCIWAAWKLRQMDLRLIDRCHSNLTWNFLSMAYSWRWHNHYVGLQLTIGLQWHFSFHQWTMCRLKHSMWPIRWTEMFIQIYCHWNETQETFKQKTNDRHNSRKRRMTKMRQKW